MKFTDLQHKTNKIHYMIYTIFENNEWEDADVEIEERDETHYKVSLTFDDEPSFNTTVNIAIGWYSAICEVLPDDTCCDDSYFIFQCNQDIRTHYEIIYK